jgi:HNH endonuclease/NUMOD4 motif
MNFPELWLPVVGIFETHYDISTLGRVRRRNNGKILHGTRQPGRGVVINLSKHGAAKRFTAHKLVLTTWIGECPPGQEALHGNDIDWDNRLVNLRWGTHQENIADQVRNGGHANASKTSCIAGHPLSGDNLRINGAGKRCCIQCNKDNCRAWKQRRKDAESTKDMF